MPMITYTFEEFRNAMNCPFERLGAGKGFVFENGGKSDGGKFHLGPPDQAIPRLKMRMVYYSLKLKREEIEFHYHHKSMMEQLIALSSNSMPNVIPPGPDDVRQLKAGKARIEKLRAKLAELQDEFNSQPEIEAERKLKELIRQQEAERIERIKDIREQIMNITI